MTRLNFRKLLVPLIALCLALAGYALWQSSEYEAKGTGAIAGRWWTRDQTGETKYLSFSPPSLLVLQSGSYVAFALEGDWRENSDAEGVSSGKYEMTESRILMRQRGYVAAQGSVSGTELTVTYHNGTVKKYQREKSGSR